MAAESAPTPTFAQIVLAALLDCARRSGARQTPELQVLLDLPHATELAGGRWLKALALGGAHVHPADQPLALLTRALALAPVEQLTVALLASIDEDPLLARLVAVMQHPVGGSLPSLGLLALAFADVAPGELPAHALLGGAALASGLVTMIGGERPLAERALCLPTPIYLALRGREGGWPGVSVGVREPEPPLPASTLAEAERQARALGPDGRSLVIRTASLAEGRAAATALARALGRRPAFFDAEPVPGVGPWLLLRGLLPVFCYDLGPGERRRIPEPVAYDGPILALAGPDGVIQASTSSAPEWTLGVPARHEREALWHAALGDAPLAERLAREQRHGAGRIAQLARMTRRLCVLDGSERPSIEHVQKAAWTDDGPGLTGLAIPLPDAIPDAALVTAGPLAQELELLLLRCRARDGLADGLGASAKTRYRPGVRALFVGPSGIGKTLAAGWLATRLGMPLYRVDLAAVTSKYIGETEKNLAQLLARAEHAGVVLLFDEADSMFGKRTDVKDANDRFANAQTNYLLQRIESFDGVTLLTSNSRSRFDAAFTRRLDAILDFVLPAPEERRALWVAHLGTGHRLDARALNKLAATVDLAGGHIRNVVFAAAVLAGAQGRAIGYADVVTGLVAEFRKLGRQLPQEIRSEDG